jgi:hypothetical protein
VGGTQDVQGDGIRRCWSPSPKPDPYPCLRLRMVAEVGNPTLSLAERVASRASRVRGYLVWLDPVTPPRRATDTSPGRVPMKCIRIAVHPLPLGEGKDPIPIDPSIFFLLSAFCFLLSAYFMPPTPGARGSRQ